MSRWIPRSSFEALIQVDALLADLTPKYRDALSRVEMLQPGMSGRPAGSGDPGGGSTFSSTSVVERSLGLTTLTGEVDEPKGERDPRPPAERVRFDLLLALPVEIERALWKGADWSRVGVPGLLSNARVHQRLAWCRYAARTAAATTTKVRAVERIHGLTCDLHELVIAETSAPSSPRTPRQVELASDLTEQWCTNHLRVGAKEPRSPRYSGSALCRWCGDFRGEQGFMPTLTLLDAHRDHRRISTAMVAAEKPVKTKKRRKR